jgi:hypothetical protein
VIGRSVARLQAMGPEARIRCQIGFSLRALSQCSTASGTDALDLATRPQVSSGPGPWVLLFRAPCPERRAQRLSGDHGAGAGRRPPRRPGGMAPHLGLSKSRPATEGVPRAPKPSHSYPISNETPHLVLETHRPPHRRNPAGALGEFFIWSPGRALAPDLPGHPVKQLIGSARTMG